MGISKKKYGVTVFRKSDGLLELEDPVLHYPQWLIKWDLIPVLSYVFLADILITSLFAAASPTPFIALLLGSMLLISMISMEYGYRRESFSIIYFHIVSSMTFLLYIVAALPFLILNPDFTHGHHKKPFLKWLEYWGSPLNLVWAFSFIVYSVLSRPLHIFVSYRMFKFVGMNEGLKVAMQDEEIVRKMQKPREDLRFI